MTNGRRMSSSLVRWLSRATTACLSLVLIAGPIIAFATMMQDDHDCDRFRPAIRLSAPHDDAGDAHRHVNGNRRDVTNPGCCGTFCGGAVLPAYSTNAHHIWLVALIESEPSELLRGKSEKPSVQTATARPPPYLAPNRCPKPPFGVPIGTLTATAGQHMPDRGWFDEFNSRAAVRRRSQFRSQRSS